MRSSLRSVVFTVCSLALLSVPASHAGAAALCRFDAPVKLSPGLSAMTTTSGTFTTGGQTGQAACRGDIAGKEITGPGTVGFDGTYAPQTCSSGDGAGTATLVVPTAAGPTQVSATFTFQRASLLGSFSGDSVEGFFLFMPSKGDCFSAPVTEAMVHGGAQFS